VGSRIKSGQKFSIRIKSDIQNLKAKSFEDEGYGEVVSSPFDDFILLRANGYPSIPFATAVDDWKMDITHVIRGVEWVSGTAKHLYLCKALQVTPPTFMHLPLILSPDGRKLSVTDPSACIANLRLSGYLPEAIVNYIALLGLAPRENREHMGDDRRKPTQHKSVVEYCSLQQLRNTVPIP
jgi:nondiscriminating glutamyl-tRNA synthetase